MNAEVIETNRESVDWLLIVGTANQSSDSALLGKSKYAETDKKYLQLTLLLYKGAGWNSISWQWAKF